MRAHLACTAYRGAAAVTASLPKSLTIDSRIAKQSMLNVGARVEVQQWDAALRGAWFPATIVSASLSDQSDEMVSVQYDPIPEGQREIRGVPAGCTVNVPQKCIRLMESDPIPMDPALIVDGTKLEASLHNGFWPVVSTGQVKRGGTLVIRTAKGELATVHIGMLRLPPHSSSTSSTSYPPKLATAHDEEQILSLPLQPEMVRVGLRQEPNNEEEKSLKEGELLMQGRPKKAGHSPSRANGSKPKANLEGFSEADKALLQPGRAMLGAAAAAPQPAQISEADGAMVNQVLAQNAHEVLASYVQSLGGSESVVSDLRKWKSSIGTMKHGDEVNPIRLARRHPSLSSYLPLTLLLASFWQLSSGRFPLSSVRRLVPSSPLKASAFAPWKALPASSAWSWT